MDYQQILELVKEVSKAGLTNFEYTEGNIRIAMSCPQPEEKIVVPASNIALQEAIGVSANSVNGANTAVTGSRSSRGKGWKPRKIPVSWYILYSTF